MRRPKGPSRTSSVRQVRLPVGSHYLVGWWHPFRGLTMFELWSPGEPQPTCPSVRRHVKECAVKRPSLVPGEGMPSLAERQECITLSRFPYLEDLLCEPNWDDLSPKGKRCVMMFIDDATVRILIKLEGAALKASCVARDIDDCLMVMEKLLATGQVVWERDEQTGGRQPKKKK